MVPVVSPRVESREAKKRVVWEWIDEHAPYWWDEPVNPALGNERIMTELTRLANDQPGAKVRRCEVARWLTNPREWTPYVDQVAVDRALAFDWEVIASLTPIDRGVFLEHLADMDDPWDERSEDDDDLDYVNRHRSERRRRWLAGPDDERGRLRESVTKRRLRAVA